MNCRRIVPGTLLFLCFSASVFAQVLPKAANLEDLGFSSERLSRITRLFQSHIDKGSIPGAVIIVARDSKITYSQALGFQDREQHLPMKTDSIFRIASMTKPITSVAVMMLVEEGKIDLLAPVFLCLPDFKDVKVGVEKADPATGKPTLSLEAPVRPMTVQDLLCHTSGLVYGPFGNTLVHQAYNSANLFDANQTLAEFVSKLSKLPLAHQPGAAWEYGMSIDVLGRIVEVTSGLPFDRFIEERIAKPLAMSDTVFYLSASQAPRLAQPQIDPTTGKRPEVAGAEDLTKGKQKWFSGGGGLLSTAPDYAHFCQMLLNGGALNGTRLLSPKTIAIMASDQLPPGIPRFAGFEDLNPSPEIGESFGLGFAVRTDSGRSPVPGSVGDFFWAGIHGTYFWVDPKEKLFAVLMVQISFDQSGYYRRTLREMVYSAVIH